MLEFVVDKKRSNKRCGPAEQKNSIEKAVLKHLSEYDIAYDSFCFLILSFSII